MVVYPKTSHPFGSVNVMLICRLDIADQTTDEVKEETGEESTKEEVEEEIKENDQVLIMLTKINTGRDI